VGDVGEVSLLAGRDQRWDLILLHCVSLRAAGFGGWETTVSPEV